MTETTTAADLFDRAARALPDGWELKIILGHHSGGVVLIDPDGDEVAFPTNHENLIEEVGDALDHAIEAAKTWEAAPEPPAHGG